MADKGIGFDRNIRLDWMDAAAAERLQSDDVTIIRQHMMTFLERDLSSREGRLKTSRLLAKIWHGTQASMPELHADALELFRAAETATDRKWLHFGMTMVAFPFFRDVVSTIGRQSRFGDEFTTRSIRERLFAERGEIAIIKKSAERSVFFLRQLGVVEIGFESTSYVACHGSLHTSSQAIEQWLVAALIAAQPGRQAAFEDLFRMPELFGFCLTIGAENMRRSPLVEVIRQGSSWDLVRTRTPMVA